MTVSTHVLDAGRGGPGQGITVALSRRAAEGTPGLAGDWRAVESGVTDADGRLRFASDTPAGTYRLAFATGPYFTAWAVVAFYPEVTIAFTVTEGHFHVPLLLSPYAYSTYRGS
ncbi:MAG TPA: hydroxyisourate hydrolase [Trebonia sp.]|jgi:5-hydroxyisourate hydrolase